jgi:hypothetical protein
MLGANQPAAGHAAAPHHHHQLPALTFDRLLSLSAEGRFGRDLPGGHADDRTFIVVADAVAKQLDGLKRSPGTAGACRRFFGAVLDRAGPGGFDFCTLLGAHEGEGLVAEQSAGSARGRDVAERGQRVDAQLVETALFFSREIAAAAGGGGGPEAAAAASCAQQQQQQQQQQLPPSVPVILLSSDNGQIALAKAHGLPVLRVVAGDAADRALRALLAPPPGARGGLPPPAPVTSAALREALAPLATAGVASEAAPLRSLQAELDGAAALLGAAVAAYGDCVAAIGRVAAAAGVAVAGGREEEEEKEEDAAASLEAVRRALADWRHDPGLFEDEEGGEGEGEGESGANGGGAASLARARRAVEALRAKSAALGSLVRTTQAPSRVMRWASGLGSGAASSSVANGGGGGGD